VGVEGERGAEGSRLSWSIQPLQCVYVCEFGLGGLFRNNFENNRERRETGIILE